ncbi:hypothetical protein CVT26_015748 [Gymnopilus dilepis]|uniref:YDG domain-containing protein n=1 Tax=Gymnopilus dilepis TaxID=231916 RepID=A0A409VFM8_9AGAR|nr:hypothetical protein CVT26_015748 [Gymnopilus dilepis]
MAAERIRARLMADPTLYNPQQMGHDPRFGHVPRIPVLTTFADRKECSKWGVHKATVAGISGSSKDGAYSICVSNGYEDDEDDGDRILYTGTGGQPDPFAVSFNSGIGNFSCGSPRYVQETTSQMGDQSFEHKDNAALKISAETGKPVRVVRGPNKKSPWAPEKGYRYDGLYIVKKAYLAKGQSGYIICRYELQVPYAWTTEDSQEVVKLPCHLIFLKDRIARERPDHYIPGQMGEDPKWKLFGEITVPVLTTFASRQVFGVLSRDLAGASEIMAHILFYRKECTELGVHRSPQSGIDHPGAKYGACAIVLSGEYEDDVDVGDKILYTGAGGRVSVPFAPGSGRQIAHQSFLHSVNAALRKSVETGRPVRVIRKAGNHSRWAPAEGPKTKYRYDGLYRVKDAYEAQGVSGFRICRYELEVSFDVYLANPHSRTRPVSNEHDVRKRELRNTKKYPPDRMGNEADPEGKFGDVDGVPMFAPFADRWVLTCLMSESLRECADKGVHKPLQAGIWGSAKEGAYSIVVSGGYEDDKDEGDRITYTGAGGRDSSASGKQVSDQKREYRDNAALFTSYITGKHIRVIRGASDDPADIWAPFKGLRYDGLYKVTSARETTGKSGHSICEFVLERLPDQKPLVPRTQEVVKAGGSHN